MTDDTTPRIYVASLTDYNDGELYGTWIDIEPDVTTEWVESQIALMLKESPTARREMLPAEEYAIHDTDNFGGLDIGEYEPIGRVVELAHLISEHGPAFAGYANYVGLEYATPDGFQDAYEGEWESEEEFAQNLAGGIGIDPDTLPSWPFSYIDWERAAGELFMSDYFSVSAPHYMVFVFRCL